MKQISYAITAHNEHGELDRLLSQLDRSIQDTDEVIIQVDTNVTEEVLNVVSKYLAFTLIQFPLNNDFASFKNNLIKHCHGDYIFQIDADEYLSNELIEHINFIIDNNDIDLFLVPRINTVEGLTQEHINKWGWRVDASGWVNYPDYQTRIWKNTEDIKWVNKVHERITGFASSAPLPYGYDLIHPKRIERQEKQNAYYNTL
jgi:glycosyltransferase involved in cell wall biosynthesis